MKAWLLVEIETPAIVAETQAEAQGLTDELMQHLAEIAARRVMLRLGADARVLRYGWAEAARNSAQGGGAGDAWEAGRE